MEPVRLAMVGCGKMGQSVHLRNFLQVKRCSVVAVCDRQAGLAREVAEVNRIPRHVDSVDALIKECEFDAAAAILLWPLNVDLSIPLMEAGKHVYLEKPMAANSDDARRMVDCAKTNDVKLMVAYMKRYDTGCQRAKRIIDEARESGSMGKITYARCHDFVGDWQCGYDPPAIAPKGEVKRPNISDGVPDFVAEDERGVYAGSNAMFCHILNLMRYLLGDPQGIRAATRRPGANPFAMRSVTVFDYGDFDCTLETGSVAKTEFDEGVRINFETGWLDVAVRAPLNVQAPATVTVCKEGDISTLAPEYGWSFRREAEHFIDCVADDKEPLSSGEDSLKDMLLLEEMYKTYRGG
ncbi:MAG: Gfo/Idh/MocA family oxidoreductase [Planctomycetes bacterium]|nr:Gfo/Idh/MocA family oxidoreductase [Planctomycetota bacterium]